MMTDVPDDSSRPRKRTMADGKPSDSRFTRFLLRFIGPPAVSPLTADDVRALEEVKRTNANRGNAHRAAEERDGA